MPQPPALLLRLARHQPFNRGALRRLILNHLRKRGVDTVRSTYHGVPFVFHLDNPTENKALFGHYNNAEVRHLLRAIDGHASRFVDLGANSGFYTQVFLHHAAPGSRALAIEPNPAMRERIAENYALLAERTRARDVELAVEPSAASDVEAELYLDLSGGAGAAHLDDAAGWQSIRVRTRPLQQILDAHGFDRIDVLKIDIEGHEDKALMPFFAACAPARRPRSIIIEHTSERDWAGDLWACLARAGYRELFRTRGNAVLALSD